MIIKKKKNNDNNDNNRKQQQEIISNNMPEVKKPSAAMFDNLTEVTERQERRRGDRRRAYRRIEDRSLVSRAHEEAKIIKEQAAQEGFQNGISKASDEISVLQDAISNLIGVKEAAYQYYKNDIAEIAVEVARKILNAQVQLNPETIIEITENVIKEVSKEESHITFIINPADELILKENLETNSAFKNKKATMSVQTDENIEQGSCKVVTASGQIDATFSSQLGIIRRAFEEGI